jgi:serine/threonine kinase 38
MKKTEMVFKNQIAHVKAERDVLAAADNPWIV